MTAILSKSSEPLEILDPPVSESGTSDFVEFGLVEQILELCIGYKLEHPVFLEHTFFLDSTKNLMLIVPDRSPLYFHLWKHAI
jgi:hypothetical protein